MKVLIILLGFITGRADAEEIQFTQRELNAVFTLMRPELNKIELHGRRANFMPAPSIRFFGVEPSSTYIDMSMLGNMADIEFNHVTTQMPILKFSNHSFQLVLNVNDQPRAIQSRLGAIHFKNVSVTATLAWKTVANGMQELILENAAFSGTLNGTGVLRSQYVLNKVKNICTSMLTQSLQKFLAEEKIQTAIQQGLITWAGFYSGHSPQSKELSGVEFFEEGIRYQVQNTQ